MLGGERLRSRHAALFLAAGVLLTGTTLAVAPSLHAEATEAGEAAPGPAEPAAAAADPAAAATDPAAAAAADPAAVADPAAAAAPTSPEIDAFLAFLDRLVDRLAPPPSPPPPPPSPQPEPVPVMAPVPLLAPVPVAEPTTTAPEPATMLRPVPGDMMRGFGMDGDHDHKGVDLDGEEGDPILAAQSGTVVATSCGDGYGICTVIDHGHGLETWYAHLSEQTVTSGHVARGQVIGLMGCTGSCTGSHLHFEVHVDGTARDPLLFL
jgi:murein DD-endopeptidase MepM/ murein hydrolase activator NlpD